MRHDLPSLLTVRLNKVRQAHQHRQPTANHARLEPSTNALELLFLCLLDGHCVSLHGTCNAEECADAVIDKGVCLLYTSPSPRDS